MNFLFQVDDNGQCSHSFVHDAYIAVQSQKTETQRRCAFSGMHEIHRYSTFPYNDEFRNWCPVGSIEFVHKWFELNNIPIPKPINIPIVLFDYSNMLPVIKIGTRVRFKKNEVIKVMEELETKRYNRS